ncbi:MAG: hypothetical protein LBU91_07810 [Bacteroidales bacterium]|nr:hypothetical protein [Bacteroidales bacterium]
MDTLRYYSDSAAFHQLVAERINNTNKSNSIARAVSTPYSGSFKVLGNVNTFYPVAFVDNGWWDHEATILTIAHPYVHTDGTDHGSVVATFRYHISMYGHNSEFIDADVKQYRTSGVRPFIAGWEDASINNGAFEIVVWLRGQTTYSYRCSHDPAPYFNNGSFAISNKTFSPKTQVEKYVNSYGLSYERDMWVGGYVRASEVKVCLEQGCDYVFEDDYKLMDLQDLDNFVKTNKHLPEVAPAAQMEADGINVSEMNALLLKKVEELTLYIIDQNKELQRLKADVEAMRHK